MNDCLVHIILTIFGCIFIINGLNTIECPSNTDCQIICDTLDPINGCAGHVIDASDSISLEIICSSSQNEYYGGCQFSDIFCPTSSNSSCDIKCNDYYACYYTKIHSESSMDINVRCSDEIGSCLKTILYANYSTNADISCFGGSKISSTTQGSCDNFEIYGKNVIDEINLSCDGDYACKNINFYVNDAYNVDIFARGLYALSGYIHAENSNNFHLFCGSLESQYACYQTYIFTPTHKSDGTPRAHIECQGTGCKDELYFYSKDGALDVDISLNDCAECDGQSTCIDNWYFYCDYFTFGTFHGDSCDSTSCDCNYAVNQNKKVSTDNFNQCDIIAFDYECNSGKQCIIDCNNDFVDGCYDKRINANNATSLHIICDGSLSCKSSYIYCPSADNSQCIVDCLNKDSCKDTVINVVNSRNSSLNLTCFDIDSCATTNVYAEDDSNILINCMSYDSCLDINVTANHAKNITILCDSDSTSSYSVCNKFKIYALNVTNQIKLICIGDHSCYYIDIHANYSNNVIIDANGDYATYYGNIFAQNATNMVLSCGSRAGGYSNYGCYHTNFFISTSYTSIECEGYGCYYLSLYSLNGFSDIKDISINGCNQCNSVDNCIYNWNMHCDDTYSTSATYYGYSYCYYSGCDCDDPSFMNLINNGWSNTDNLESLSQCQIMKPNIYCKNDQDCIIQCNATNSCEKDIISGNNATSMTVICDDSDSCQNTKIYCPKLKYSECNIVCNGYDSCRNAVIYGGINSTVNVMCTSSWSCQYGGIFVENSSTVNINCLASGSCYQMDVEGVDAKSVTMNCLYSDSCEYTTVHVENTNDIKINCTGSEACYNLILYGNNANMLSVSCIGQRSCYSIDIYGNNASNIFVYGIGTDSMDYGVLHAENSLNATLQCESYKGDRIGCGDAKIYVPPNDKMNIKCIGYGCDSLRFYTQNGMNDIQNISLNGDGQCVSPELCIENWYLYCGLTSYNSYTVNTQFSGTMCIENNCDCNELQSKIEESWKLGTESFTADADIRCTANSKCVINCVSGYCENKIIDATQASSLLVNCYYSSSCTETGIYCPSTINSSCIIKCDDYQSCYKASIVSPKNTKLYVTAEGQYSFKYGTVLSEEIYQINLDCFGDESCYNTNIYAPKAHIANIECYGDIDEYSYYGHACYGMNIFVSEVKNQVTLSCHDRYSCGYTKLYANNAKNVAVFAANGENTLYDANIYAENATNFILTCVSESNNYGGCYRANIYAPPNDRSTLNCYGFGCYNLYKYVSNGMSSLSLSNINLNGCGVCFTPTQCISQWTIYCGTYDIYTQFSGSTCIYNGHYCDCNQNTDLLTNNFVNNIVPQCFSNEYIYPTATPTTSPTTSPTSIPTVRPTISPTINPTINPITSTESENIDHDQSDGLDGNDDIELSVATFVSIIMLIILAFIILCLIGVVIYCWKYRKQNVQEGHNDDDVQNVKHIPLTSIGTNVSETSALKTQTPIEQESTVHDGDTETFNE